MCDYSPLGVGLAAEHHQIFASLFATLADCSRHEHFASPRLVGHLADYIDAQNFEFYFTQTGVESGKEKFANGGCAANGRMVGPHHDRVHGIGAHEIVELAAVACHCPILRHFPNSRLCAADDLRSSGSPKSRSFPRLGRLWNTGPCRTQAEIRTR